MNVETAIQDIKATYPFPDIFEDTEDTIRVLGDVLRELGPTSGRLLDIGCGALDKPAVFQHMGFECFACDTFQDPWHLTKDNLERVLSFAEGAGIEVFSQTNGLEVPWEEGSFDIITIINVVEHLHDSPRDFLNFAGRLLKPGGLLVVNMPNSVNLRKRLSVMIGKSNYTPVRGFYEAIGEWRGHVREYTLSETTQIIRWSGFEVIGSKMYHGMVKRRLTNPLLRLLFRGICSVVPTYKDGISVAARKPVSWTPRQADSEAMREAFGVPDYAAQ